MTKPLINRIFILFSTVVFASGLSTRAQNNCGVIAKMNPEGDSILRTSTSILFQNASINATDYQFIINGIPYGLNNTVNTYISPGLTDVKLVAYNGNCTDTTEFFYFFSGQPSIDTPNLKMVYGQFNRDQVMEGITRLRDNSLLVFGYMDVSAFSHQPKNGVLLKTKETGCLEWARKIPVNSYQESSINAAKEAPDGNIYLISSTSRLYNHLTKVNASGNWLWTRSLNDGSNGYQKLLSLVTTPDAGAVTLSIPLDFSGFQLTRWNNAGQILWQKPFISRVSFPSHTKNMLIKDGYLYLCGIANYNNTARYDGYIWKYRLSDGQPVWAKKYVNGADPIDFFDMLDLDSMILTNIISNTGAANRPTIGGHMLIDTSGSPKSASLIGEIYAPNPIIGPFYPIGSTISRSGNNFYIVTPGNQKLSLQGDGRKSVMIGLDSAFRVKWVHFVGGQGQPQYYHNAPASGGGFTVGGVETSPGISPYPAGGMFSVRNIDTSGGVYHPYCPFNQEDWETFTPNIIVQPAAFPTLGNASAFAESLNLPWEVYFPEMRYRCPDYVDSCSYLKLTGQKKICRLSDSYTYKSHKNSACGQPTVWNTSPGVQVITQTDSSIEVRFSNMGRYVIYGRNPLSCIPVEDSIVVLAESGTMPPDLGPDFSVCPGNTKILHAGNRFKSYRWQDGSTDSLLSISQPGQYWVQVSDSCDNIFADTIRINAAPPIPFTIGPDRTICASDTIQLVATPGFASYLWSPAYRISATSGASIIADPLVDTTYTVMAEMTPGCFAYDTVHIVVNQASPLSLGLDTSICRGDSLVLDAGSGFTTYAWNTGSTNRQIMVRNPGIYSVTGSNGFGCVSSDTFSLLNLFDLPVPRLDKNPVLCEGESRLLDPGPGYSGYLWNTGSASETITVNSIGTYYVDVTDTRGCKGSDTVRILKIQLHPKAFLPPDTAICPFESLPVTPTKLFSQYLWSNGSTGSSITVKSPGIYWLQVKDQYGCSGEDSLWVSDKTNCLTGVFVPNAFTPNGDRRNDLFKPIIKGNLQYYDFRVFNRWGELVFHTSDPNRGWDGRMNGLQPDNNTFVWVLTYAFEGHNRQTARGTVLLLR